ncbi:MAG: acyl carrier protein [Magnetococcales bacterium]|nr:acyl carrier protein [Magnetococcales bacterium]
MEQQIKQLMADILNLNPNTINESTSMDSVDTWDSFNHLNLCLAMEQAFGITLEVAEIEAITSFRDICQTIQKKALGRS